MNRQTHILYPALDGAPRAERSTVYDGLGHVVQSNDEDQVSTVNTYDFRGLLTSVTLAAGTPQSATTVYEYDSLGNLIAQTDAEAKTAAGVDRKTTFEYDALGRRTARVLPGNIRETAAYDSFGAPDVSKARTESRTDFNGRTINLVYDRMDRLVRKELPAIAHTEGATQVIDVPATTVAYVFNASGQPAWVNQVAHAAGGDQTRTAKYAYDDLGRLRAKANFNESGGPEGTLSYSYNADGTIQSISARTNYNWNTPTTVGDYANYLWVNLTGPVTHADSAEWNYAYDQYGRLQKVNPDQSGAGADAAYAYDLVGALKSTDYRNGLQTSFVYNERNWLRRVRTTKSGVLVANFDYDGAGEGETPTTASTWAVWGLSATGQRQRMLEKINGVTRTVQYYYDPLRRLVNEAVTATSGNYGVQYDGFAADSGIAGFDRVGNRPSRQVTMPVENTTLRQQLAAKGLTSYKNQAFDARDLLNPGNGFTYDANGNTIADANGAIYVYDAENRLVKRSGTGLDTIRIEYDDAGNRTKKTVTAAGGGASTVTKYLVAAQNPTGYAQVMEERDGSGATVVSYVYGLALISQKRGSAQHYYGFDGQGTVRYLTDAAGAVTDTYTYDAFGILIDQTAVGNQTDNNYRYTGQQWDPSLGMYYLRARYYQPQTGRFWTMDTFEGINEDPLSLHKYLYCQGNPLNELDPSGHFSVPEFAVSSFIQFGLRGLANVAVSAGVKKGTAMLLHQEFSYGTGELLWDFFAGGLVGLQNDALGKAAKSLGGGPLFTFALYWGRAGGQGLVSTIEWALKKEAFEGAWPSAKEFGTVWAGATIVSAFFQQFEGTWGAAGQTAAAKQFFGGYMFLEWINKRGSAPLEYRQWLNTVGEEQAKLEAAIRLFRGWKGLKGNDLSSINVFASKVGDLLSELLQGAPAEALETTTDELMK